MIFTLWFFLSSSRAGERFAWTLLHVSFALTDVKHLRNLHKKNIENIHIDLRNTESFFEY